MSLNAEQEVCHFDVVFKVNRAALYFYRVSCMQSSFKGSINFNKTTEWELYILQYHQKVN